MAKEYFGRTDLLYLVQLIKNHLDGYVKTESGKGLSKNDFTDELKNKLSSIDLSTLATNESVQTAIGEALGEVTGISFVKIDNKQSLPRHGVTGTIYLVPNDGSASNSYDEYFWDGAKYELFGSTEVDLSDYVKSEDISELDTTEVAAAWNSVFGA